MTVFDTMTMVGVLWIGLRGAVLLAVLALSVRFVHNPSVRHALWVGGMAALLLLPAAPRILVEIPTPFVAEAMPTAMQPSADFAAPRPEASLPPETNQVTGVVLVLLWLGGALALLLAGFAQYARVGLIARRARHAGDAWAHSLREAAAAIGSRRAVPVRISPEVAGPLVHGVLRPVILLPPESAAWDRAVRQSVLLHELAHVQRRDLLAGALAEVACCLHWVNPLVWYGVFRLRQDRELACDASVIRAGIQPSDYSAHLLAVARASRPNARHVLGFARSPSASLRERVLHVFEERTPTHWWRATGIVGALVLPAATLQIAAAPPNVVPASLLLPSASGQATERAPLPEVATPSPVLTPSLSSTTPPVTSDSATTPQLTFGSNFVAGDPWTFSLDASGIVKIDLFSFDGAHVATLAEGSYEAGRHDVMIAPTVSPGVYMASARVGESRRIQRVRVRSPDASR